MWKPGTSGLTTLGGGGVLGHRTSPLLSLAAAPIPFPEAVSALFPTSAGAEPPAMLPRGLTCQGGASVPELRSGWCRCRSGSSRREGADFLNFVAMDTLEAPPHAASELSTAQRCPAATSPLRRSYDPSEASQPLKPSEPLPCPSDRNVALIKLLGSLLYDVFDPDLLPAPLELPAHATRSSGQSRAHQASASAYQ